MRYVRNRKYPITHYKKSAEASQPAVDLSLTAAAGILAVTLGTGMVGGYLIKKFMR